jgi:hypothetical protein
MMQNKSPKPQEPIKHRLRNMCAEKEKECNKRKKIFGRGFVKKTFLCSKENKEQEKTTTTDKQKAQSPAFPPYNLLQLQRLGRSMASNRALR